MEYMTLIGKIENALQIAVRGDVGVSFTADESRELLCVLKAHDVTGQELVNKVESLSADLAKAQAENKRLRGTLEYIAMHSAYTGTEKHLQKVALEALVSEGND